MQGRNCYRISNNSQAAMQRYGKDLNCSVSTTGSSSPRESPDYFLKNSSFSNKEKSQLCKRFMENGYCPYERKCKFAHGCEELKRNQETNSKYKTKECGVYINQGYCPYGDRCNFIHQKVRIEQEMKSIDEEFIAIRSSGGNSSRLLKLLE